MTSRVSFHWLLTLFALVLPAALGPSRPSNGREAATSGQQASSDVIFRHYL